MITIETEQILVPKQVYIGDKAELRCTFSSTSELKMEGFCEELDFSKYDIRDVQLLPSGNNFYTFIVTFVPWRTGEIVFPDYSLGSNELILHFNPVKIVSITEKDSITTLKDSVSPLLLPGTVYKLYTGVICLVIVLIVGIRLVVKHKKVAFFINTLIIQHKNKKNKRKTIKLLEKIKNDTQLSDHDTAGEIQKIMRNYLEKRFDFPFSKIVTSEMAQSFVKITNNLLVEEKQNACDEIINVFVRTDYIRYSSCPEFLENERVELIEKLITNIEIIEKTQSEDDSEKINKETEKTEEINA